LQVVRPFPMANLSEIISLLSLFYQLAEYYSVSPVNSGSTVHMKLVVHVNLRQHNMPLCNYATVIFYCGIYVTFSHVAC
jgi:hypothetical protein